MKEHRGRITFWEVEVFLAVADELSISAAAKRLGASASSISQQLSNLESALACELVNRRERPLSLTAAGDRFRLRAQRIQNELAEARAEATADSASKITILRIGMIEDFEARVAPALLERLATDLPGTRFELATGATHRLLDHLESGALDVVVTGNPDLGGAALNTIPVLMDPFVAVARKGILTKGHPPEDLLTLPFIRYTKRHVMGRVLDVHLTKQRVRLDQRYELDSYHSIMAMVAGGGGWSILTALGVAHAQQHQGEVDVFPLPFAPLSRRLCVSALAGEDTMVAEMIAVHLRDLLNDVVIKPGLRQLPWLSGHLRLL